jgi:hypothetical protein
MNPITGIAVCWAGAANGHAAIAPPTKRMNWRRLIVAPEARTRNGSNLIQRSRGGRGWSNRCPLWAKSGHSYNQNDLRKARFNEKSGSCQVKIQIFSKLAA